MTIDVNVGGTLNILEALRILDQRPLVLLAGSSTAYGRTAELYEGPIPENAPLLPATQYGQTPPPPPSIYMSPRCIVLPHASKG